jgi:hypothetical protein
VHGAAGELPQEPGVDGTEADLAAAGAFREPRHVPEQPGELRGGEVRVEDESGLAPDRPLEASGSQASAQIRRATILPDDRPVHRTARVAVPHDGRLTLVRDAERRDLGAAHPGAPARAAQDPARDPPDLLGVVLDPPRLRIVLRELAVGASHHAAAAIEDQGGRAGRALVDGDDDGHALRRRRRRGAAPGLR